MAKSFRSPAAVLLNLYEKDQEQGDSQQTAAEQIITGPADPGAAQSAQDLPGREQITADSKPDGRTVRTSESWYRGGRQRAAETRGEHLQLLIPARLKSNLRTIAAARKCSINDLCNRALEDFLEREREKDGEY